MLGGTFCKARVQVINNLCNAMIVHMHYLLVSGIAVKSFFDVISICFILWRGKHVFHVRW